MTTDSGARIYTGPWIDWSRGSILGATLTLSDRSGGLLTAFLAVYVGFAGACTWRILCYLLHQTKAGRGMKDGLHHQQQVILRNTGGSAAAAWELLRLGWHWRNLAHRPFWRCIPLVLTALLNLSIFAVASIFSSEVSKAPGNLALITSSGCGFWNFESDAEPGANDGYSRKMLNDTLSAAAYARACYQGTQNILECNRYPRRQIKWNVNPNASCPFDPSLCWNGDNAAYQMDTGPIDSHFVLGINAPEEDRVTYRRVVTCSVLNDTNRAQVEYEYTPGGRKENWEYERYYLGPTGMGMRNFTYEYLTDSIFSNFGYDIRMEFSSASIQGPWEPIPELNRTDADVSLFFLAGNTVRYTSPVMDPWFSAQKRYVVALNQTFWLPDRYVRILGCTDQHQFCSATDARICTKLAGSVDDSSLEDIRTLPGLNIRQTLTGIRLWRLWQATAIEGSVRWRGTLALRAQDFMSLRESLPLPDNQWQIEVSDWMAVSMAMFQQGVVEFAAGPSFISKGLVVGLPDIMEPMCHSQKVRHSGNHISFSICGMSIILIVGSILIILNLVIDTVGGWCQNLTGKGRDRESQWLVDEKLQLQRCAYDRAGQGVWTGTRNPVPLTERGQLLDSLADPDETHSGMVVSTDDQGTGPRQNAPLLRSASESLKPWSQV